MKHNQIIVRIWVINHFIMRQVSNQHSVCDQLCPKSNCSCKMLRGLSLHFGNNLIRFTLKNGYIYTEEELWNVLVHVWFCGTLWTNKSRQDPDCSNLTGIDLWIRSLRNSDAVPLSTLIVRTGSFIIFWSVQKERCIRNKTTVMCSLLLLHGTLAVDGLF